MKTRKSDFASELLEPLRLAARAWALALSRMETLPVMSLGLGFLSSSASHMGLIILPGAGQGAGGGCPGHYRVLSFM